MCAGGRCGRSLQSRSHRVKFERCQGRQRAPTAAESPALRGSPPAAPSRALPPLCRVYRVPQRTRPKGLVMSGVQIRDGVR